MLKDSNYWCGIEVGGSFVGCNATTILYGTAWTDATLLAQQRAVNLASEERTAQRDHFEYDWHSLAAIKPSYHTFVEQEIARLGEEDATIQTQYLLRPVSGADLFFNPLQLVQLQGKHSWEGAPAEDECYIAGMDIGGEERPSQGKASHAGHQKRDSTVITIGRLYYNELNLPCIEVVFENIAFY